jgi:HlyD family secretion protein
MAIPGELGILMQTFYLYNKRSYCNEMEKDSFYKQVTMLYTATTMKYFIFSIIILCLSGCSNTDKPLEFETYTLKKGSLKVLISATGTIQSEANVDIKCKASGQILKLPFDVGDKVEKGMLLLELDPVDENRRVELAQTALEMAQLNLEQAKLSLEIAEDQNTLDENRAKASYESAKADYADLKQKYERQQGLLTEKLSSQELRDSAYTAMVKSKVSLEQASLRIDEIKIEKKSLEFKRQQRESARLQVQQRTVELNDAKQRLKETRVYSPMTGIITNLNVREGQIISSGISSVTGGTSIMTVSDIGKLFVSAKIDETEIGKLKEQLPCTFTVDGFPFQTFKGKVGRINPQGNNLNGITLFSMKIQVEPLENIQLFPGMNANVSITVADKNDTLILPYGAIFRDDSGAYVYKGESPEKSEKIYIKAGLQGEDVEIISGMKEGETILLPKEHDEDDPWEKKKKKK